MTKMVKYMHENFVEDKTKSGIVIFPSLLYKKHKLGRWHYSTLRRIPNKDMISEFKLAWQWRCPEVRRDTIYRMIMFEDLSYIDRLKYDFDPFNGRYRIDSDKDKPKEGRYHSSEGLWNVWSSWDNYHNKDNQWDQVRIILRNGTLKKYNYQYVANWYKNIHEGR